MQLRRALRAGLLVLIAAAPFLLTLTASRPAVPAERTGAAGIPALPEGGDETDLIDDRQPLPLFVDDLPDRASREALEAYRAAGILEPGAVQAAFEAAIAALVVTPDSRPGLAEMSAGLLAPDVGLFPGSGDLLADLGEDESNRDRLINAAGMLFGYGALLDSGLAQTPETSPMGYPFHAAAIEDNAAALLQAVGDTFGPSLAQVLNQAFIESLTNYDRDGGDRTVELAEQALGLASDDVATRLAVADLQARRPDGPLGWQDALVTLEPLLDEPATELQGHIGRGDAYLAAASLRFYEAPRTARVLARRAIDDYDAILREATDAGVYAGRARALAILGRLDDARAAMDRAVELAPESVDFRLTAAALAEAAGDVEAMRDEAEEAFGLTENGWNPSIATVRFVPGLTAGLAGFAHPGDLGMFGASVGSTRDHVALIRTPQGGGLVADVEIVPPVLDPQRDQWRRSGFAPDVATYTAVQASLTLQDPARATRTLDDWSVQEVFTSQELIDEAFRALQFLAWAVEVVATGRVPVEAVEDFSVQPVMQTTEATLRRAGRHAELRDLCQRLLDGGDENLRAGELLRCIGDSEYLLGNHEAAIGAYDDALEADDSFDRTVLVLRRAAIVLVDARGDGDARAALDHVAARGSDDQAGSALVFLAGDDLAAGDVAVARAHYDLALAVLDIDSVDSSDQAGRASVRRARVQALINRGVASLRLAQDDPQQPPRCTSGERRELCDAAADDIEAALAIDPLNPIALMDLGWVARSRDDVAAARDALGLAVEADPGLFPALNDLGVLAARDGDGAGARAAFTDAVATEPEYALGWWNLGVLELDGGLSGLRAGQAALARAVELDPSLAGRRVEFRTDEAVYQAAFDGLQNVSSGWPVARTYGLAAAVLGAIGLLTALGKLTHTFLGDVWNAAAGFLAEPDEKSRRRRRMAARLQRVRSRLPAGLLPWAPWLGVGAVLVAVTTVTVWLREPAAVLAALVGVLLATGSAVVVHELAHTVALRRYGGRLLPAQWTPGAAMAVLLLPLQASSGPYLGERVQDAPEEHLVRIHAAGPVANLVLAAAAYGVYVLRPAPVMLLVAQVSLAVCAYTLLPNAPLDGKVITDRRPVLAAALGLLVASAGTAFTITGP